MIKNYWKIAVRNVLRYKGYSAINVAGLAIGIAACLLLFLVIRYENSYEKFNTNYSRIYRAVTEDRDASGLDYNPGTPFPAIATLRTQMPDVTIAALNAHFGSQFTVIGQLEAGTNIEKKFLEDRGAFFMEPEYFKIFDVKWLSGNADVLKAPNMAVLSKATATKYFGSWEKANGQTIRLDNSYVLTVGGVFDDQPLNSDMPMSVITSYATLRTIKDYGWDEGWGLLSSNHQVMILRPENMSEATLQARIDEFNKKNFPQKKKDDYRRAVLQPLSMLHFDDRMGGNFGDHVTSKASLLTLSLIGILIIVMACINFVNLSTAQAIGRSREVGVRKVLGGNRWQLFWQMMGETAVIVVFSVGIALLLAQLALPYLKTFINIEETPALFTMNNMLFLLGIAIAVTLLAGSYPALVLSGFRPALALKNKITSANVGGISIRRGLVITQFAISQVLIIGTIIAVSQMNFVRNADLGFKKDAVLVLNSRADSAVLSRQTAFKAALKDLNGVVDVSRNSDAPSSDNNSSSNFSFDHRGDDEPFDIFHKFADEDYFKTYQLELLAGRPFRKSDTISEIVVNETFVEKVGAKSPEEVIGKEIRLGRGGWKPIVGVVKDFKTNSLRESIKPLEISSMSSRYGQVAVKFSGRNFSQTNKAIKDVWEKFYPEYAYSSFFVDENIAEFYLQEEQLSRLYKFFAALAIFISCLGLYGLVSFMAVQKTKEVGIRKVLGASTGNIVYLFSKEFTILISIAFVIATPLAWLLMNNWLQDFVFRVHISIGVFIVAILISLGIAWITVGYKAVRAALASPVKSLRSE
ncbi:ABC transporter permease [Pseudobacter ginsenosidimutans]|jgi:predicted permease|uniref:Putative permease n=1 Tax=Pseudobacter ginsenosidimutans TaxID=661488 RepID=A0A4Q7N5Z0_9BACT|nr:ABC transporter permease [Pseudobacter ginsenosidimutans]QEC44987.1 FtsX-like permease family protein [Pseudobacter ginsenosidimutans]RZS76481.1 putative permease [Pseudobacter ginsenosidimutans]